ncbi:T9SS type A sorting domain-containing protein [Flavobacterium sp. RHBU_3]|uniref:T9SS type A sorting domain-containing protein n=1 Tax=Flavobacterium sp. RHBU_3 TaxID=3391184 RepID=UPI003984E883
MKKFTLTSIFVLALSYGANAQDCSVETIPYTLDFETATAPALPDCTTAINVGSGNTWEVTNNPGFGFDNNAISYTSNTESANAWFFTKGFDMVAGTNYRISYKYGNNGETTESFTTFLSNGATDTAVMSEIATHPTVTGGQATVYYIGNSISTQVSGTYYLAFHVTSAASQGTLYLDDIAIEPYTCPAPTNIVKGAITSTSASFSWTAPTPTPNGYFYAVTTSAEEPANFELIYTTSKTISSLQPATKYYFHLRSFCGSAFGDWLAPVAFTTPACDDVVTVPFTFDFSYTDEPTLPACSISNSANGNNWAAAPAPGNGFDTQVLQYTGNNEDGSAWFFTQGIQMEAGVRYKISFTYGNSNADQTESLRYMLVKNPDASAGSATPVDPAVTGATAHVSETNFIQINETGIYYFGLNAYSAAGLGSIYVDNITIEESTCGVPSDVSVTDITQTTATLNWAEPTEGNSPVVVYFYGFGTADTPPATQSASNGFTAALTDLLPNTTYYLYTGTLCGPMFSEWVVTEFTTPAETSSVKNDSFKTLTVSPNPATDNVVVKNDSGIDSLALYNITGQIVKQQNVNANTASLNTSDLAAGIYVLSVTNGGQSQRVKLIKK